MRISDWSSDVCSSDLNGDVGRAETVDVIAVHLDIQLRHLHQRKRAGPDEIVVHAGPLSLNRRPQSKQPVRTYAAADVEVRNRRLGFGQPPSDGAAQERTSTRLNSSH